MSNSKSQNKERVIIVGCGEFGCALATTLSKENKSVAIIDMNEDALSKFSSMFGIFTIVGDGMDTELLEIAGAKNADILIAVTNDDNTNIMIAQIAKQIFQIKKVIVRVYDLSKEITYKDMDIMTISPARLSLNEYHRIVAGKELDIL